MWLPKQWRTPKVMYGLLIVEFPLIVAILALTGIASPNLYRTKLWQEGGDLGFNSKPITVVYAAANYRPVKTPLVWSQFTTSFNLVISVLSMFLLLTKLTMYLMHVLYPIISVLIHAALIALWAYGIYAQTAPDTIDPRFTNNGPPWYITKSCSVTTRPLLPGYCKQAKATFAVSVIMIVLYGVHFFLGIWSCVPTKEQKLRRQSKLEEKQREKASPASDIYNEQHWQQQWELQQFPRTPGTAGGMKSPMTPRTRAFQDLGGGSSDLPFRRDMV